MKKLITCLPFPVLGICFWLAGTLAYGQAVNYNKIVVPLDSLPHEIEERLVQLAWQNYPKNRSLQLSYEKAQTNVKFQRRSYLDNLNFNYTYNVQRQNANQQRDAQGNIVPQYVNVVLPRLSFGLNLNLSSIFNRPLKVDMAKRELEMVDQSILQQKLFIRSQVLQLYQTYTLQLEVVKTLTTAAEDSYTLSVINKKNFENGILTADEYIRSINNHMQLVERQKTSELNMLIARTSLEEIIGVKLEEVEKEFNVN
jgi:outer membrane protein TolC